MPPLIMLLVFLALVLAVVGFWKAPATNVAVVLLAIAMLMMLYGRR